MDNEQHDDSAKIYLMIGSVFTLGAVVVILSQFVDLPSTITNIGHVLLFAGFVIGLTLILMKVFSDKKIQNERTDKLVAHTKNVGGFLSSFRDGLSESLNSGDREADRIIDERRRKREQRSSPRSSARRRNSDFHSESGGSGSDTTIDFGWHDSGSSGGDSSSSGGDSSSF